MVVNRGGGSELSLFSDFLPKLDFTYFPGWLLTIKDIKVF